MSDSMAPTFDVIITTYKRPEYVTAAVRSCLMQGPHLRRVIVIDDCSSDDTQDHLNTLRDSRLEIYLRTTNGGTTMARHDGLRLSKADWSIHIDDDWELLPGCLDLLAAIAKTVIPDLVMIGGRILWDDGQVTPEHVPETSIGYREQLEWRSRQDGLGVDHLCCISKKVQDRVNWPMERVGWHSISIFFLDAAKLGTAIYTTECLALEKAILIESDSRGTWQQRFRRRKLDAPSGVRAAQEFIRKHGAEAKRHGRPLLGSVYRAGAMYRLLEGDWFGSISWALQAVRYAPFASPSWLQLLASCAGPHAFRTLYAIRG